MGVRGGTGSRGQSLRSLRLHIRMCSLNARGEGLPPYCPQKRRGEEKETVLRGARSLHACAQLRTNDPVYFGVGTNLV